jgi:hypothetical protein
MKAQRQQQYKKQEKQGPFFISIFWEKTNNAV